MDFAPKAASPLEDSSSEEQSTTQLPPQSENDYQPECPITFGSSQCNGPPQQTSFHSQDSIPIPSNDEANPIPVPALAHQQTPAAAAVQLQPFSSTLYPAMRPAKHYPTNHVYSLSIALNMMFVVCFFLPGFVCSLPALIFSIQAKEADRRGNYRRAGFHYRISVALNIVAIIFWVCAVIIGTVITVIGSIYYAVFIALPEALNDWADDYNE